jgi:IMP dehydrogenase
MNEAYTYSDVLIEPQYSEIESRSKDVDISTTIGNAKLSIPVVSANMRNITGPKMAAEISKNGGLGILHRFCSIEENVAMYTNIGQIFRDDNDMKDIPPAGVSIGVKDEEKKRFESLYLAGARIFCIDVAHGHHVLVKNMLKWINDQMFLWDRNGRRFLTVIAGNVATAQGYADLVDWGADAVKVGIGPSPVCRTRYNTGVGVPQLYALEKIYEYSSCLKSPKAIIADGGISHVGDISKALRFADAVMIGSMIAGCSETPGNVFRNENGEFYKVYGGSASGENKGENRFVEGTIKTVPFRGHVKYILREITQGLQSAFSYTGVRNHKDFQLKCKFVRISEGTQKESRI